MHDKGSEIIVKPLTGQCLSSYEMIGLRFRPGSVVSCMGAIKLKTAFNTV